MLGLRGFDTMCKPGGQQRNIKREAARKEKSKIVIRTKNTMICKNNKRFERRKKRGSTLRGKGYHFVCFLTDARKKGGGKFECNEYTHLVQCHFFVFYFSGEQLGDIHQEKNRLTRESQKRLVEKCQKKAQKKKPIFMYFPFREKNFDSCNVPLVYIKNLRYHVSYILKEEKFL